jgi:hypothetical protein
VPLTLPRDQGVRKQGQALLGFAAATLFGMTRQKLRWIHIEGLTSIYEAAVELRDLNVLVGANGAGKSNLIRVLEMAGRIVGGELGLFTGIAGGASALRTVDFPAAVPTRLRLHFSDVSYAADLIPAAGDELIFADENVSAPDGEPSRPLARGYRETMLPNPDAPWYALAAEVIEAIQGCRVYHFHDTGPAAEVKKNGYAADNEVLRPNAGKVIHGIHSLRVIYLSSRRACIEDGLFPEMIGLPHANQRNRPSRCIIPRVSTAIRSSISASASLPFAPSRVRESGRRALAFSSRWWLP